MNKSLSELLKKMQVVVDKVLNDKVAPKVKEVMREEVYDLVYNAYHPKQYHRTGELANTKNMLSFVKNGELLVRDVVLDTWIYHAGMGYYVTDEDRDVAMIVEYGKGYSYNSPEYNVFDKHGNTYLKPRPFTAATRKKLKDEQLHIKALKDGLKQSGLEVK